MSKEPAVSNKISFISEIGVVTLTNEVAEFTLYLGNIDFISFDKENKHYCIMTTSGSDLTISDENAGCIIHKLWMDFLNGGGDSDKLDRIWKMEK